MGAITALTEHTSHVGDMKEYDFSFVAGAASDTLVIGFEQVDNIQVTPSPGANTTPTFTASSRVLTLGGLNATTTYYVTVKGY